MASLQDHLITCLGHLLVVYQDNGDLNLLQSDSIDSVELDMLADQVAHFYRFCQYVYFISADIILMYVFNAQSAVIINFSEGVENQGKVDYPITQLCLHQPGASLTQVDVSSVLSQPIYLWLCIALANEMGVIEDQTETGNLLG